jgi:hypothetical protein
MDLLKRRFLVLFCQRSATFSKGGMDLQKRRFLVLFCQQTQKRAGRGTVTLL